MHRGQHSNPLHPLHGGIRWFLRIKGTDGGLRCERRQDNEVLEQIQRDVNRTHAEHPFFEGQAASSVAHRAALTRALQVFAKLNPGLLYVQVRDSSESRAKWKTQTRDGWIKGSDLGLRPVCNEGKNAVVGMSRKRMKQAWVKEGST
jgi:hypothetical protein